MTDSLLTTDRLIEDAARAERQVRAGMGPAYRTALLDARNKLRSRANDLAERLENGDAMYPHDGEPMPPRYEEEWLRIEKSYRKSYDAQHRATQAL